MSNPKYIIAIGGGEVGKLKTLKIDQYIVELCSKKKPRLLFIPTASNDSPGYIARITEVYGDKLGCEVNTLLLISEKPTATEIKRKINDADIIYIGGGNTLKMMRLWRRLGVDKLLTKAYNNGTIMCGMSAGSICWYEYGHSDSMSFYHPDDWDYIRVRGLGLLKGIHCPHFDGQTYGIKRRKNFADMIKKRGGTGIAIDNHAAIVYKDDQFKVINSKPNSGAWRVQKKHGKVAIVNIPIVSNFQSVTILNDD